MLEIDGIKTSKRAHQNKFYANARVTKHDAFETKLETWCNKSESLKHKLQNGECLKHFLHNFQSLNSIQKEIIIEKHNRYRTNFTKNHMQAA